MTQDGVAKHHVRTVRFDDAAVNSLLDKLDVEEAAAGADKRKAMRYAYRMKSIVVHMQQPGAGTAIQFSVPTRDISASGVSFLHGGFVHPGTKCLVQLITTHGTWNNVVGKVTRTSHVDGSVHLVAVQFETSIDPSVYCAAAAHSRVLHVEDDEFIARLAKFHLEELNADVDQAQTGEQAVEMGLKKTYDVVLMDIELPKMDGLEATRQLRSNGYTGMIVALTALTQVEDRKRGLEAGCDKYLTKPFTKDDLSSLIQSLREEPIFSNFADDPSMADLINEFVVELPQKIRAIELAAVGSDTQGLIKLARHIKAQGGSYGFDILTEAAETVEKAILKGGGIEDCRQDVDRLVKLCLQARSSVRNTAAGAS